MCMFLTRQDPLSKERTSNTHNRLFLSFPECRTEDVASSVRELQGKNICLLKTLTCIAVIPTEFAWI